MKVGVIFFHSNIRSLYKERWIKKCIDSITNQTFKDFKIYEINYGGDGYKLFDIEDSDSYHFENIELRNHAMAMNFIISRAFNDGCDYVFNTNLDDYYSELRIEKQLEKLEEGYDIVASDFCYIEEYDDNDIVTFRKGIKSTTDIGLNLEVNHNVIAHPVVAYSRKFWESNKYVQGEIPQEDLKLWKRAYSKGDRFYILDDELLFYRLHSNQITGDNTRK